jgi:membrane fusion protein, copper/silver efflux system
MKTSALGTRLSARLATPAALLAAALLAYGCGEVEPDTHAEHASPDPEDHRAGEPADAQLHDHGPGEIRIAGEVARRLGVTLTEARREDLHRTLRASGEIVPDETRLSTVSLRFGGWAERLHVDFTGRFVEAGSPLLEVYSPELVSAQEDLLSALRLAGHLEGSRVPQSGERSRGVVDAARERLRFWQVPEREILRVEETGEVRSRLTLDAPFTGYVLEKGVQAGERFEAGAPLYRLADLSRVWLEAEVHERDLPFVGVGTPVEISVPGRGGDDLAGRITYVLPQVDRDRRTTRVRIELPNPGGRLRPGMYATVRASVPVAEDAVTVPRDAVMHTGRRALVFVATGEDLYEAREVRIGAEADDRVEIREGLRPGEPVVARAGFILDSESRLMEAMMGQPGMPGTDMELDMDRDHGPGGEDHDEHEAPDVERDDGTGDQDHGHSHPGGPHA